MFISFYNIDNILSKNIKFIYIIINNNFFIINEIIQKIRLYFNLKNYKYFKKININKNFNLNNLEFELKSKSLFKKKKIIYINFENKIYKNQFIKIENLLNNLYKNIIIIISLNELYLFKNIKKNKILYINIPKNNKNNKNNLILWIKKKLILNKIRISKKSINFIINYNEFKIENIITKLKKIIILNSNKIIKFKEIYYYIISNNTYNINDLNKNILNSNIIKYIKIMKYFKKQKKNLILILWSIIKNIENLIKQKNYLNSNKKFLKINLFNFKKKKNIKNLLLMLKQAYKIDKIIKGIYINKNLWDNLTILGIKFIILFLKNNIINKIL